MLNPLHHLIPHHIGIATQSIESELPIFEALGFEVEGEFIDAMQGIRGVFLIAKHFDLAHPKHTYRLELLENLPNSTKLDPYLKNHHKLYHIAFESQEIRRDSEAILNFAFTQKGEITMGGGIECEERK